MSSDPQNIGALFHPHGTSFRVWAPFARGVAVIGSFNDWAPAPLSSEASGYWSTVIKNVKAGQEYKFIINTGPQEIFKNDPRSLQVTTSAGNSVIVDQTFDWGDDVFVAVPLNERVIYELHIGTFNRSDPSTPGTFETASEKLDYLAGIGVNTVELMPVSSMSMDRGWGYASDYMYAVESLYGGRHGLLEFVRTAHLKGIAVILDVVYNHLGPDASLDLWQFDGWSQDGRGGIYFYNDYRAKTPWGETRPDYGRPEVRQYILDNVRMWVIDCHIDGLRVDSTIYVRNIEGHNNDPTGDLADGWSILQSITELVKKLSPTALTIAEDVGNNDYITKLTSDSGAGFSTQWEVNLPNLLRTCLAVSGDTTNGFKAICDMITSRYNNDAFQRVIYSDSHDSAANGNSRFSQAVSPDDPFSINAKRKSLFATALIMTAPGIPMLFQGQEFLENGSFNDWQALDWSKANRFAGMVLGTQHLIALRKNQYGNTHGLTGQVTTILCADENNKVLVYHRAHQNGPGDDVVVIANFSNSVQTDFGINFPRPGLWRIRFNSNWEGYSSDFKVVDTHDVQVDETSGMVTVAPYSLVILSQDS